MYNLKPINNRLNKKAYASANLGNGWVAAVNPPAPSNWGTWLQNQPAPKFKPNHKLTALSTYLWGQKQEYGVALDQNERWGYALNVGYQDDFQGTIDDAANATPSSDCGKLLKLAITNPTKYGIAAGMRQPYPPVNDLPDGYVRDANGNLQNTWSPEATAAALATATTFKLAPVDGYKKAGARIEVVIDGGETGVGTEASAGSYEIDPRIVAAKGNLSWFDYLSNRAKYQLEYIYAQLKTLLPNHKQYQWYALQSDPYVNVPGRLLYTLDYQKLHNVCTTPGGSLYYRDAFAREISLGNPSLQIGGAGGYYDVLTQWACAVAEQIADGKPWSYNFISGGWRWDTSGSTVNKQFASIDAYKGFIKCLYALGATGNIATYHSSDCDPRLNYPPFDAANPPHWLLQQMALGEVHAQFSWLDDYIINGDLVVTVPNHPLKPHVPGYDLIIKRKVLGLAVTDKVVRGFARKLKNAAKYLIVVWTPDNADTTAGKDTTIYVHNLDGMPPLKLVASGKGSTYLVDNTGGAPLITQVD